MSRKTGEIAESIISGNAYISVAEDQISTALSDLTGLAIISETSNGWHLLDSNTQNFLTELPNNISIINSTYGSFASHIVAQKETLPDKITVFTSASAAVADAEQQVDGFGDSNAFFGSLMSSGRNISDGFFSKVNDLIGSLDEMRATIENLTEVVANISDSIVEKLDIELQQETDPVIITALNSHKADIQTIGSLPPQERLTIINSYIQDHPNSDIETLVDNMTLYDSDVIQHLNTTNDITTLIRTTENEVNNIISSEIALEENAYDYLRRISDATSLESVLNEPEVNKILGHIASDDFLSLINRDENDDEN